MTLQSPFLCISNQNMFSVYQQNVVHGTLSQVEPSPDIGSARQWGCSRHCEYADPSVDDMLRFADAISPFHAGS